MNYCPLNLFSGYTFLSSTLKIEDIFSICDKFNYPYFGICDLSNMFSFSDIEKNKKKFKVKPLYGATIIYLVNNEYPLHLSLFIYNEEGYTNLIKIISEHPEGITLAQLKNYQNGLIAILPTISNSEIKVLLQDHDLNTLEKELTELKEGFLYFYLGIEIYEESDIYLINLLRGFAKDYNFQTVAFNKHLYLNKSDAIGLSILNCIKEDRTLTKKEEEGPYYFLSEKAINSLYLKSEIENTLHIADILKDYNFNIKRGKLFNFQIDNKKEYLKTICLEKLTQLKINSKEYLDRIDYELNTIEKMGYLDYFLIVRDYVLYAKKNNIPVGPGRGSSAGSLISYLLDITEIDSIKYDLLFERFLNPERISMPDIDVDFADYKRNAIIDYLNDHYGSNKISSIITFQKMGAKQSLRDIGRVFSINNSDINILCSSVGHNQTLVSSYRNSLTFKNLIEDDYFLSIVKLAKKIEGLPRQSGLHAAGVIINNDALDNVIPIIYNEDGTTTTQFEAGLLEELGFLKMDILGLTNLTIIENMISYIHHYFDQTFSIKNIPFDDQKTFKVLNEGLTCGIFQLESRGITKALKEVKINSFDDIIALIALYRPGPMDNIPLYARNKNLHQQVKYIHPLLKPILEKTYGVIVYQEQIMQIAQKCALFTLGKADVLRRAISKKDSKVLSSLKEEFIQGAIKNNLTISEANQIYDLIYKFANYGFNKSHSVAYSIILYQMAYIKANYPTCFYACLLNHLSFVDPRMNGLFKELNYFSLNLQLPSISKSKNVYVIEENKLYLPFSVIKGLNKQSLIQIENIQKNKIDNFATFMKYAEKEKLSDEAIINLINAGCFDEFNLTRTTLRAAMNIYRSYYQIISNEGALTKEEQLSFMPVIENKEENEQLKYELEYNTLNILLSGSLLANYKNHIHSFGILPLSEQISILETKIKIAVIIKKIKVFKTKKQEEMASLIVQDDSSQVEVIVFHKTYIENLYLIKLEQAVIINGYFRQKEDELTFVAEQFSLLEVNK